MGSTNHSLFLTKNNTVMACGENTNGQLGMGNTDSLFTPTLIPNLTNVKQVDCGLKHSLFLMDDGTVMACGYNAYGQLGMGNTEDLSVPTLIPNLNNVKQINCGTYHSIFLLNDGTVKVCGYNYYGQLGRTGVANLTIPTLMDGVTNVKQVAGQYSTMCLLEDGTVKVCGMNTYGQLGNGDSGVNVFSPTLLSDLSDVSKIACSRYHSIFLLNDGTIKTCGANSYGQLGIGGTAEKNLTLTPISNLTNIKDIACGTDFTMFLLSDGTVKACGRNGNGQLGTANTENLLVPTLISGLSSVKQIACGDTHSLFLLNNSTVKSCGYNANGQLGMGNNTELRIPITIPNLNDISFLQTSTESITIITMKWDSTTCGINASVDVNNPLLVTASNSGTNAIKTTKSLGSGKYYMEFTIQNTGHGFIGICNENFVIGGSYCDNWNNLNQKSIYLSDGYIYPENKSDGFETIVNGSVIGIKIDTVNKNINFSVNGVWGTEATLTGEKFYPVFMNGASIDSSTILANFGATPFSYLIPNGYGAADDSNIPTPTLAMIWDKETANTNVVVNSNNPLQTTVSGSGFNSVKTNIPLPDGKIYMEFTSVTGSQAIIGICNEDFNTQVWNGSNSTSKSQISYYFGGMIYPNNVVSDCGALSVGSTVGVKFDTTTRVISFFTNNKWSSEYTMTSGTTFYPVAMNSSDTSTVLANFGASEFKYAIPEGYVAANTGGIITKTYGLLLKSNDKYYSINEECYNSSTKSYTELADITDDSFATYGFSIEDLIADLTIDSETFKPIDKFTSFSLVSIEEKSSISLKARKSDTELIVGSNAFDSKVADSINFFKITTNITNNSSIKIVVSIDNGVTWKTTDNYGLIWTDLTCKIPLKEYTSLTTEELETWEAAKTEIKTSGFDSTTIETTDFNSLKADSIIFAYVLYQDAYDSSCDNLSLAWEFNSKGTMVKMSETECKVSLSDDKVIVTPTSDQEMMKINILNGLVDTGGGTTEINPATSTDIQNILSKGW